MRKIRCQINAFELDFRMIVGSIVTRILTGLSIFEVREAIVLFSLVHFKYSFEHVEKALFHLHPIDLVLLVILVHFVEDMHFYFHISFFEEQLSHHGDQVVELFIEDMINIKTNYGLIWQRHTQRFSPLTSFCALFILHKLKFPELSMSHVLCSHLYVHFEHSNLISLKRTQHDLIECGLEYHIYVVQFAFYDKLFGMVLDKCLDYIQDLVPFEGERDLGVLEQRNEGLDYLIDEIESRGVDQNLVENIENPAD